MKTLIIQKHHNDITLKAIVMYDKEGCMIDAEGWERQYVRYLVDATKRAKEMLTTSMDEIKYA